MATQDTYDDAYIQTLIDQLGTAKAPGFDAQDYVRVGNTVYPSSIEAGKYLGAGQTLYGGNTAGGTGGGAYDVHPYQRFLNFDVMQKSGTPFYVKPGASGQAAAMGLSESKPELVVGPRRYALEGDKAQNYLKQYELWKRQKAAREASDPNLQGNARIDPRMSEPPPSKQPLQQNYQSAPMYEQFKQSDYYKNIPQIGATVTGSSTIDGQTYTFPYAREASAYNDYMRSLGGYQVGRPENPNAAPDYYNGTNSMADFNLESTIQELAAGQDTGIPSLTSVDMTVQPSEKLKATTLGQAPVATTYQATAKGLTQQVPGAPAGLGQVEGIAAVTPGLEQMGGMEAAQLTPTTPYVQMAGVEGVASPESMAIAAQAELDPRATVQYQLGELMSSLEEGKPMPAWASPQVRKVNAIMQSRGLGASSMASAAIIQSLMESGVQIAAADANKYAAIQLQNLDNRQKAALQNAATVAAMDRANLSARLQGAVTEAQALLSVDLKNLDNQQKTDTLNYSVLTQGLFKDAAEENARQQFNAKNELQVEEFFAELGSQIETINANRTAAMRQFNVSEANAMNQFNAQMRDSRDKFNTQMQFAVDQSNVTWRREINTINTANQNETNRLNAQMQYNATQNALNNLWQQYRDNAAWNFQKSENVLQRQHETGTIAMQLANQKDILSQQQKDDLASNLGEWLGNIALAVIED